MPTRKECANALRFLAIDAIEKAKSGHPGAPMGMADMAEALWRHALKHNPAHPQWVDRDRFVLSNGHASMLLYGLLHLTGYDLSIQDIMQFRQLGSKTPGHPEHGVTPGVEVTTGPLGQGIANAVGMAIAERHLAAEFNRPGHTIVDHCTWVFLGDGCMMEGISHEACSLAGTLGLGKLIALYDANGISIDGKVEGWFDEDTGTRFTAYGWHVQDIDGHDSNALDAAIAAAKTEKEKPSLIICRTHIAYGSPSKVDTSKAHGSPLGAEEITATRNALGWKAEPFSIPKDIADAWDARAKGTQVEHAWQERFVAYKAAYPELAAEFVRRMDGTLPQGLNEVFDTVIHNTSDADANLATRVASKNVLERVKPVLPELVGGSADLTGSVGTMTSVSKVFSAVNPIGNYINYGVREFAMGAIMNGMALHGGVIPYAGTFLMFADYAKNAIRMAALMKQRVIWVLTHDSIGVGEDGPTHQPVEQLGGFRLTPGVRVWRPCDSVETAVAWQYALQDATHPSCLSLSRQSLPFIGRDAGQVASISRGGYILRDCQGTPELILIGTGSETPLCMQAAEKLREAGVAVRVVSMPSTNVFDAQDAAYRESVLPAAVRARIAVEAAAGDFWYKYVGLDGAVVGMPGFGESAPGAVLAQHFGFTVDAVVRVANQLLSK